MKLDYDPQSDAAFVYVDGPIPPGGVGFTEPLDQDRLLRYDEDGQIIAYEFLSVRRLGVRLDDLEHREELTRLFREAGVEERDWSTPRGTPRVVKRRATG
jgi:uncharacterized protein YuzE